MILIIIMNIRMNYTCYIKGLIILSNTVGSEGPRFESCSRQFYELIYTLLCEYIPEEGG